MGHEERMEHTSEVAQTNNTYVKKSPGWVNFGDALSSFAQWVYTISQSARFSSIEYSEDLCHLHIYVSNKTEKPSPVNRKLVAGDHRYGGICIKNGG
jgi:hypothetical protein